MAEAHKIGLGLGTGGDRTGVVAMANVWCGPSWTSLYPLISRTGQDGFSKSDVSVSAGSNAVTWPSGPCVAIRSDQSQADHNAGLLLMINVLAGVALPELRG